MGYIFGPNYIKANKRWLGIRRDSKIIIDECSSIDYGGVRYHWAPSYNTLLTCEGSNIHDYLFGETTPIATVEYGNETLSIYRVMNKWASPSFAMNQSSPYYQFNDPTTEAGALFHTLDGSDIIINSSEEDKPLSECNTIPVIVPGIAVYAICCSKTGSGSSAWRNPFTGSGGGYSNLSPKPGKELFVEKWAAKVGGAVPFKVACELEAQGATVNAPIALNPTYYEYRHSTTLRTTNYTTNEMGFEFRQETSASLPYRIVQATAKQIKWTPGTDTLVGMYAGQLLKEQASPAYNNNNANHFQLTYYPMDTDPTGENYRFWGYVAVMDEIKLERKTLQF